MKKISVIVPVYNVAKYLEECISSITNQTYENLEIILVDDGSNDGSEKICDNLAKKDSRISVVHQVSSGPSKARNTALEIFTGDYFTFVDSDDIISEDFCQILYDMLVNTTCDFSACRALRFFDGDSFEQKLNYCKPEKMSNSDYLQAQFDKRFEFGAVCKLYKRNIATEMSFKNGKLNEDVFWAADLLDNFNNGVICTDEQLYFYRQKRKGSIMTGQAIKASHDLVSASYYMTNIVKAKAPYLLDKCLFYATNYPLMLLDKIAVNHAFNDNKQFLYETQNLFKKYYSDLMNCTLLNKQQKHRIKLFATNRFLYYINAYIRLFRVYLYKIIKKDPYKDGHGI